MAAQLLSGMVGEPQDHLSYQVFSSEGAEEWKFLLHVFRGDSHTEVSWSVDVAADDPRDEGVPEKVLQECRAMVESEKAAGFLPFAFAASARVQLRLRTDRVVRDVPGDFGYDDDYL